jgi:hypothetical protein
MKKRDNSDLVHEVELALSTAVQRMAEMRKSDTESRHRITKLEQINKELLEVLIEHDRRLESVARTDTINNHLLNPRHLLDLFSRQN